MISGLDTKLWFNKYHAMISNDKLGSIVFLQSLDTLNVSLLSRPTRGEDFDFCFAGVGLDALPGRLLFGGNHSLPGLFPRRP